MTLAHVNKFDSVPYPMTLILGGSNLQECILKMFDYICDVCEYLIWILALSVKGDPNMLRVDFGLNLSSFQCVHELIKH